MEVYEKAREAAYRVLLKGGISSLPFDVVRLIGDNGVTVYKNSSVNGLREGEYAAVYYDGVKWFIVYDETIPSREYKRLILAHELGRKALNQPLLSGFPKTAIPPAPKRKYSKIDIPVEEKEADSFARYLLAPLFVLRELNIADSRDIARLCQIPIEAAEAQAEVLEYYRLCNADLTPLEKQLYERFADFIEKYRP